MSANYPHPFLPEVATSAHCLPSSLGFGDTTVALPRLRPRENLANRRIATVCTLAAAECGGTSPVSSFLRQHSRNTMSVHVRNLFNLHFLRLLICSPCTSVCYFANGHTYQHGTGTSTITWIRMVSYACKRMYACAGMLICLCVF